MRRGVTDVLLLVGEIERFVRRSGSICRPQRCARTRPKLQEQARTGFQQGREVAAAYEEPAFKATLDQALNLVRDRGQKLAVEEIRPSDAIVPSSDMTLAVAKAVIDGGSTQSARAIG